MVIFNIRETGNKLLSVLEKELHSSACRLTIDLLIPDILKGDKDGLSTSILTICKYLDSKLMGGPLNVELSKAIHFEESLNVTIDIKGIGNPEKTTQRSSNLQRTELDAFAYSLPYPTVFVINGTGLHFSFTMPFIDECKRKLNASEIARKRVLLVEDDDMTALVFISFMEEWDYVVTRVSDGAAAIEAGGKLAHDIILMDTSLPTISGEEAIKNIRQLNNKTPIIVLTSLPIDNDFTKRYAGANNILIKPVSSAELQRMLTRYAQ